MSAYAGTREDVHFGNTRQREPEVCSRENNGLLSELGRKHLLGSGVGERYKVRNVRSKVAASPAYWLVRSGCHHRSAPFFPYAISQTTPGATSQSRIPCPP